MHTYYYVFVMGLLYIVKILPKDVTIIKNKFIVIKFFLSNSPDCHLVQCQYIEASGIEFLEFLEHRQQGLAITV